MRWKFLPRCWRDMGSAHRARTGTRPRPRGPSAPRSRALYALLFWVSLLTGSFAQEVVPDFYREPGIYPNRAYVNQSANEHIDPFNGSLQRHYVDIHIPGPGGFDLNVARSYNTFTTVNPASLPNLPAGMGWSMHFGRILIKGTSVNPCINRGVGTADNPVIELPDGGRQILYYTNSAPILMSTQRWSASCFGSGMGLVVYSPDGVRYEMSHAVTESTTTTAWYAREIRERNGNTITIAYVATQSPRISSVSTSDGRSLSYSYSGCAAGQHICSIAGPTSTWRYDYRLVPNTVGHYYLARVTRPDGTAWQYEYNDLVAPAAGSFLMRRTVLPEGGTVSYGYQLVNFANPANPAGGSSVVQQKTTSDGGAWSFTFSPSMSFGTLDQTVVSTPAGTLTYRHVGVRTGGNGSVWKIGLLQEKIVGSEQTETYNWQPSSPPISAAENNLRPGDFPTVADVGIYAPQLVTRTYNRSGTTYTTTYSSFDGYGNPTRVVEAGPNGGNRGTTLSYYINPSLWIVRQMDDETTDGVGAVVREWDSVGRMLSETRDGVRTSYSYYSSGDIQTVTRPRTLTTSYSNYNRGIPQFESHPESVTIQRVVDAAGNVRSETDGEFRTTSYDYDGLNRLTRIQPPAGNSTTISYTATTKTATRGGLSEATSFDGFGRPATVSVGGIATTFQHDSLGRLTFKSNPSSSSGTRFTYDILNRLRTATHPDNSYQESTYSGSNRSVRNERGYVTTYSYRAYGDPDKQVLMSVAAPVASASISVTRNGRGLVESLTQDGVTRRFSYDGRYYMWSAVDPETGTTTFGRDDAGNMTSRQVGSSGTTFFSYDGLNRLRSTTFPTSATPNVTREYYRTGKLRTVATAVATRTFGYDANDALTSETLVVDGVTLSAGYGYNGNGQLTSITYPRSNFVLFLNPDVLGRPTTVGPFVSSVTYWPNGQVNQISSANGTSTSYGQDSRLRPASLSVRSGATTILNSAYGYDYANNLSAVSDSVDSTFSRTYGYDEIDRLRTANGPWGTGNLDYSGSGNLRSMSLGSSYSISYAYSNNRLSSVSGTRSVSYGYDVYGNVASAGAATYQFDDASNLRTCTNCTSAGTITHRYDGSNARVSTTRSGVTTYEFWSANGHLLAEFTPALENRLVEYFYLAGKRVAQREPSASSSPPPGLTATTTALVATPNPATVSQQVTLTATVTPATGAAPAGLVDFLENGVVVSTQSLTGSPAQATLQRSYTSAGARTLQASYRGSTTHGASSSAVVSLQVNDVVAPPPPPPLPSGKTKTTVVASPSTARLLQPITFTATITGDVTLDPGARVDFRLGGPFGTSIGWGELYMNGSAWQASVTRSFATAGSITIFAAYTGLYSSISEGIPIVINGNSAPPTGTVRQAVVELLED